MSLSFLAVYTVSTGSVLYSTSCYDCFTIFVSVASISVNLGNTTASNVFEYLTEF